MKSVLLVEDERNTRARLAQVIENHSELELIAAVGNCAQAREKLQATRPDVLLTDLGLPDGDGLELIVDTTLAYPETEIMVITVFGDEKHVIGAIQAGATGYLLKDGDSNYIGDSIMQMLAGGSPISASIARFLLKSLKSEPEPPATADRADIPSLTKREHEVLRLIAKGFTYNEIAQMLELSVHTVTSHIKKIYRKFAVGSRGEAVYEAIQLGILKQ